MDDGRTRIGTYETPTTDDVTVGADAAGGPRIAVIGDRIEGFAPQDSIAEAVAHAAASLDVAPPELRWVSTAELAANGPARLQGATAAWGAPGGPFASLDGAVAGIRWAREAAVPFLGTCGGFQLGVIEVARHVLGLGTAMHAEYGQEGELFIDELLCSLVGQTMQVDLVDPWLRDVYGAPTAQERYYCRFGLQPAWREPLARAGLRTIGTDKTDGDTRIMRLDDHPFFVLTLFVPQTSSTPDTPHPLVRELVRAAVGREATDDGREVVIRPSRRGDAPALREIERSAGARFREVGMGAIADADPASVDELDAYADAGRSWVAVDDGTDGAGIVGYVVVDEVDGNAHIEQVSVLAEHQGRGIGRLLVDHVEGWAAAHDQPALTLTTFTDVPWNGPLYAHLGFRALADDELGPELRARRAAEAEDGLDPTIRICMRREVRLVQ